MPRTFFSIASLTTACLAAAACFAPPVLAQGALKPVDALIVNPPTRPVPVAVLSAPAAPGEGSREVYSLPVGFTLHSNFTCTSTSIAMPAGKRLVLEHLSGYASLPTPTALLYVGIGLPETGSPSIVVPAAAPIASTDNAGVPRFNLSSAGQRVHAYIDGAFTVCAAASGVNGFVTVLLHGYLVDKR